MRIMQFAQDMVIGLPIEAGARVSDVIHTTGYSLIWKLYLCLPVFQVGLEIFSRQEQILFDLDDLPVFTCVSGGRGGVWDTGADPV